MEIELYEKIKKRQEEYEKLAKGDYSEILKLKQTELVKRYLYLIELKEYVDETNFYDGKDPNIAVEVIEKYGTGKIHRTNEIWMSIIEFSKEDYEKFFNKPLPNISNGTMVTMYWDIENKAREVVIPAEAKDEFESTHRVISGDLSILDAWDRYFNARYQFFNIMFSEGQEVAVAKILETYGINKSKTR